MKGPRPVKPGLEPHEGDPLQKEKTFRILKNGEDPEPEDVNREFSIRQFNDNPPRRFEDLHRDIDQGEE